MIKQSYAVGGKLIDTYIPSKTSYSVLENLYDVCNELFDESCFYTPAEVLRLKEDKNNIFLKR